MPGKQPKVSRAAGVVRRRRQPGHASTGLAAIELQAAAPPGEVAEAHRAIEGDDGKVLAIYREPYGGRRRRPAAFPGEPLEPIPYKRNLREKSLEVISMYKELARLDDATEETYAFEFEEPAFITLGLCYEERPRFSGGAYNPVLKRVEAFLKKPMRAAIELRRERAKTVLALDDQIVKQVEALKAKGLTSPYLKSFVVARVNPIRFRPKDAAPLSYDEAFDRMATATAKFNPEKIKMEDVVRSGGAVDEAE